MNINILLDNINNKNYACIKNELEYELYKKENI